MLKKAVLMINPDTHYDCYDLRIATTITNLCTNTKSNTTINAKANAYC